jgi:hypothetical protein
VSRFDLSGLWVGEIRLIDPSDDFNFTNTSTSMSRSHSTLETWIE